jgi:SAM-dependent methyltransferase
VNKLEEHYRKKYPDKRRGLDMAFVNFIVHKLKKGIVLDVGCGFGELISVLREFGFKVWGLTATEFEVRECRRKGLGAVKGDAGKEIPFYSNKFDLVVCIDSLEHIKDYRKALQEMHRVLNENGTLIIFTPNREVFRKSKKFQEIKEYIKLVHFKEFSFKELNEELLKAGFCKIKYYNKLFFYPNYFWLNWLGGLRGMQPTIKEYIFLTAKKKKRFGKWSGLKEFFEELAREVNAEGLNE